MVTSVSPDIEMKIKAGMCVIEAAPASTVNSQLQGEQQLQTPLFFLLLVWGCTTVQSASRCKEWFVGLCTSGAQISICLRPGDADVL